MWEGVGGKGEILKMGEVVGEVGVGGGILKSKFNLKKFRYDE